MDAELKSLETKLGQLIAQCQQLRAENHQLRQDVATAAHTNRQLETKIDNAAVRIESLLDQLPEDAV